MTDVDRLSLLEISRDRLVEAITGELTCRLCARGVDPPLAGAVRELRAVLSEIEALSGPQEESEIERLRDDLAAKRDEHLRKAASGP